MIASHIEPREVSVHLTAVHKTVDGYLELYKQYTISPSSISTRIDGANYSEISGAKAFGMFSESQLFISQPMAFIDFEVTGLEDIDTMHRFISEAEGAQSILISSPSGEFTKKCFPDISHVVLIEEEQKPPKLKFTLQYIPPEKHDYPRPPARNKRKIIYEFAEAEDTVRLDASEMISIIGEMMKAEGEDLVFNVDHEDGDEFASVYLSRYETLKEAIARANVEASETRERKRIDAEHREEMDRQEYERLKLKFESKDRPS